MKAMIVNVINIHSFVKNRFMDLLKSLYIQGDNPGVSTGTRWLPAGLQK